jgi:3-deoxy-D-arabino-heptulosonate 7-phosphate (DAHP) synthase
VDYGHGNSETDATRQIEVATAIMWNHDSSLIYPMNTLIR